MLLVILVFLCILFFIIYIKPKEFFSFDLKTEINLIVFPKVSIPLIDKFKSLCSLKLKEKCDKINIVKEKLLDTPIKSSEKYIVLYDNNVKHNKNLNLKWLNNKKKNIIPLEINTFSKNKLLYMKQLSDFLDFEIKVDSNDLKLLSLFI